MSPVPMCWWLSRNVCVYFYLNGRVCRCSFLLQGSGAWVVQSRAEQSELLLTRRVMAIFTCWIYLLWLPDFFYLLYSRFCKDGWHEWKDTEAKARGGGGGLREMKNGWILKTSAKPWRAYFKHAGKFSLLSKPNVEFYACTNDWGVAAAVEHA